MKLASDGIQTSLEVTKWFCVFEFSYIEFEC